MLLFILALIVNSCNGQNNEENSNYNTTNCTGNYRNLEIYVLNNEDVMDNLTENFFKTGKPSTEFARITYRFKVLNGSTNAWQPIVIHALKIDMEIKYIWSSSALYLLGPKPLYYLTLSAVHLHETNIIIDLPCLHDSDKLLSRLTYLVS